MSRTPQLGGGCRKTLVTLVAIVCGTIVIQLPIAFGQTDTDKVNPPPRYDLCIQGGTVIDGTGSPRRKANLFVHDGRISAITAVDEHRDSARSIDAEGLVVTPGFIDTHAHGDPFRTAGFDNFLAMGVTTICLGQDGASAADPGDWFDRLDSVELGPNVAMFAGHGTARNAVGIGIDPNPSPRQLEAMQQWVRNALEEGCLGLTTGLEYQPGSFADLDELISVATPVAEVGGVVMSHLRSEDDDAIEEALGEFLQQGRQSQCPVHVSHLKVTYGHGAPRAERVLRQLDEARQSGQRVTADLYPYLASYTGIGIVFPDWAKPPHDYKEVVRDRRAELEDYLRRRVKLRNGPEATLLATAPWTGKTLAEVAKELDKPFEDVLIDDIGLNGAKAAYFVMDADLQERLLMSKYVMFCSDGGPGMRHPRSFGSFAKVIREYVVQRKLLSLEEAVRKMTGLSAETTGLDKLGRGRIAEGFAADLLVFDPAQIRDHATYEDPHQFATGFQWVLINGQVVFQRGVATGVRAGHALRRASP
jgi:N-acyl-D-amino-acid deacylase